MKIKPNVNASDRVRLDIEIEIKDIGDRDPELGPTWTERKIKTTVVVPDQQSIVIGGLMQDKFIFNEAKVPLLGDIPLLGYLFKYSQRQKRKTNLLVLLTPYVIKDQLDVEQIVERKTRERDEFLRSFSSLDRMKYLPQIDYGRKRGLVDEINRAVISVEREGELLRSFGASSGPPEGRLDYDQPGDGAPAPSPSPQDDSGQPPAPSSPPAGTAPTGTAPTADAPSEGTP